MIWPLAIAPPAEAKIPAAAIFKSNFRVPISHCHKRIEKLSNPRSFAAQRSRYQRKRWTRPLQTDELLTLLILRANNSIEAQLTVVGRITIAATR